MTLNEFSEKMEELFSISQINDISLNGIQVGDVNAVVKKAAFAVDACKASIDRAVEWGADVLFVHHGLFWGHPLAIKGSHYSRVKALIDGNTALFACHIPLDCHETLGNNAQIAKKIGLKDIKSFAPFKGKNVGFYGSLENPLSCDELTGILDSDTKTVIRGGKDKNVRVGIVSGSAADDIYCALEKNLDVFITGETSHSVYHTCIEEGINMLCLGHYYTETFGVKSVMEYVRDNYCIETMFIDIPTRL